MQYIAMYRETISTFNWNPASHNNVLTCRAQCINKQMNARAIFCSTKNLSPCPYTFTLKIKLCQNWKAFLLYSRLYCHPFAHNANVHHSVSNPYGFMQANSHPYNIHKPNQTQFVPNEDVRNPISNSAFIKAFSTPVNVGHDETLFSLCVIFEIK